MTLKNVKAISGVLIITIALLAQLIFVSSTTNATSAPKFYFAKASSSDNNNLYLEVRINGNGTLVNAVQADFTYPESNLTFNSIDATSSAFEIEASHS